jgi:RNA polymerase sigma-70 factor, ECF subfamily
MPQQHNFANNVAQHIPFLTRVVRNLVRGDSMTEDIVQQTALKALMNADQFRSESTLKTWLVSIAINEVRQAFRSQWRRRAVPFISEASGFDRCQRVEPPNTHYEAQERDVLVRRAVSRLPKMYRTVVELCDLQLVPLNEVARKLGLTLPAAKSRRHRARQKLRPLVEKLKSYEAAA